MELAELRQEIDAIDRQIVELVQQRMEVAARIAACKREKGLPVLDAGRERVKLDAVAALSREDMGGYMRELYQTLMAISRDYQNKLLEKDYE